MIREPHCGTRPWPAGHSGQLKHSVPVGFSTEIWFHLQLLGNLNSAFTWEKKKCLVQSNCILIFPLRTLTTGSLDAWKELPIFYWRVHAHKSFDPTNFVFPDSFPNRFSSNAIQKRFLISDHSQFCIHLEKMGSTVFLVFFLFFPWRTLITGTLHRK